MKLDIWACFIGCNLLNPPVEFASYNMCKGNEFQFYYKIFLVIKYVYGQIFWFIETFPMLCAV